MSAQSPITREQAAAIAEASVRSISETHDFVVVPDQTVERAFGWVFFYAPRQYLATHDPTYLVPGNAPLVVLRADGSTDFLGSSLPPARAVEVYEQRWMAEQSD